jgi:hypothetical protein
VNSKNASTASFGKKKEETTEEILCISKLQVLDGIFVIDNKICKYSLIVG